MTEEQFGNVLIGLARTNPGEAIAIVCDNGRLTIGILNLMVEPEDWLYKPVLVPFEKSTESIGATIPDDPGGTRTLNQLIKSH